MKYTAFSIDAVNDPLQVSVFKGTFQSYYKDGYTSGQLVQCVGKYGDTVEYSFLCLSEDFRNIVVPTGMVKNQESVLEFSENNNQAAQLRYLADDRVEVLGHLKYVDKSRALANPDGWSYRPDLDKYWIIEVSQDEKKRRAAHAAWVELRKCGPQFTRPRAAADQLAEVFGFSEPRGKVAFTMNTSPDGTAFTITEPQDETADTIVDWDEVAEDNLFVPRLSEVTFGR